MPKGQSKVFQNEKTSVAEAEKRTNRGSKGSAFFVLPHSSFVLEPDYDEIAKETVTYVTTSFTVIFSFTGSGYAHRSAVSVIVAPLRATTGLWVGAKRCSRIYASSAGVTGR